MIRELIVRSAAEDEIAEAACWYSSRIPELGAAFLSAIDATMESIVNNPEIYPVVHKKIRRALTRRFPYQIFYVVGDECVVVLAAFHARRDPREWKNR